MSDELSIQIYEGMEIIFDGNTPYMSQAQIAAMLGISRDAVSDALRHAHERQFIDLDATTRKFTVVASDGKTREVNHYPSKAILLVGFRVQQATPNAIAFQDWITSIWESHIQVLREQHQHLTDVLELEQQLRRTAEWDAYAAETEADDLRREILENFYPDEMMEGDE